MQMIRKIQSNLKKLGTPERAKSSAWFFKTGPGQYGEGDVFYGITVPEQRKVAKQFFEQITFQEILQLLKSKVHEERFVALEILVMKYELAQKLSDLKTQKKIFELYLKSAKLVNNWDLVDTSAPYIAGAYLYTRPAQERAKVLRNLALSKNLWERRIAIVSCLFPISQKQFKDALVVSQLLLSDKHDLIHKAVGWILREIGKKDLETEILFLDKHLKSMPRTTLRYAIERFPEKLRLKYLRT